MWANLFSKTRGFLEPYIIHEDLTFPASFYALSDMFEGLRKDRSPHKLNFIRGYAEGCENYSVGEQFLNLNTDEEQLITTIYHAFSGESPLFGYQSGMIINGGLQWSEVLQAELSSATLELADIYTDQTYSLDITFFIGAYGVTPFGVHTDDISHRTILFNLGPGNKGVALWQNAVIYAQFGHINNIVEPGKIDTPPDNYFFSAGQAFVLPSQRYHIGLNATLSVTAALVIDLIDDDKAAMRECLYLFENIGTLSGHLRKALFNLTIYDLSLLYSVRLKSNRNLRYPTALAEVDILTLRPDSLLAIVDISNINWKPLSYGGILYARGRHIVTPVTLPENKVKQIFSGEELSVKKFLTCTVSLETTLRDQLTLLSFMLQSGAVRRLVHVTL